ncbi:hypothetical protein C8J56DRAFT_1039962 [Mycena floridula]|nr:hypothetical protein C8J56DRAFT_1039962 [Mycena floridula]
MPAAAVYILAVVGTVAASLAFVEFVYEPHIAPKVEEWAHNFIAKREARRRQRAGPVPVSVAVSSAHDDGNDDDKPSFELEKLVSREVLEWRGQVSRSTTLRQRRAPLLDEANVALPYRSLSPNRTISDSSAIATPTANLEQPFPAARLPTPDPSPPQSPSSHIPSLSLSHPVDLDHEHDVELLSAPSSRPDSPFSSFSQHSISAYYSARPEDDVVSVQTESEPDSEISDLSWISTGPSAGNGHL